MRFHEDDRAQRFCDIFPEAGGQTMVSRIRTPGHVVAWHRHKIQHDYWCCLQGSFKVGLAKENGDFEFVYLSDKQPRTIHIPPGIYHGYMALEPNSILLYYMDQAYDPSDEYRAEVGYFGDDWGIPNK
ncbi:MAG TPA: hypothetical protein DHV30_10230 [Balneola sp.]|nr:hypothetical protein [Balneola sp.]|tara:strand:- start:6985 stop:7368 length:384 start_codon:yes stop_codon:yes gene_type:complete